MRKVANVMPTTTENGFVGSVGLNFVVSIFIFIISSTLARKLKKETH